MALTRPVEGSIAMSEPHDWIALRNGYNENEPPNVFVGAHQRCRAACYL